MRAAGWPCNGIPRYGQRFQALLSALAGQFDGRVYGINLPEKFGGHRSDKDTTGFDCDEYFAAEVENIRHTRKVFRKSTGRAVRELLAVQLGR
jgi:hypothetical protein